MSSVSAYIFNPLHLIMILWGLPIEKDLSVLPQLEIVRETANNGRVIVLRGEIEWDGVTHPSDPQEILSSAFEATFNVGFTVEGFMIAVAMHDVWKMDARLMAAHGLRYGLTEQVFVEKQSEPSVRRLLATDERVQEINVISKPFQCFFAENRQYLSALAQLLSSKGSYLKL